MNSLARQNIEVFAHYLYRIQGRLPGRDDENWLIAEKQLNENLFLGERSAQDEKQEKRNDN